MSEQTTPDRTIDLSRHLFVARAGFAAPFFSWLGVFIVVMLFYTLTAAAPMLGDIVWQDAASFATGLWSTGFGGTIAVAGSKVTLLATTITVLVSYASYVALRHRNVTTWGEAIGVGVGQAALVTLISFVGHSTTDLWRATLGAAVLGILTALWAGREDLLFAHTWFDRIRAASPRLRAIAMALLVLSTIVFAIALFIGWKSISTIYGYYVTNVPGIIGLTLIQLLYVPTYLFWTFCWLIGAGFAVGTGTNFSTLGVESAPLPALPIFGALPSPDLTLWWVVLIVVLLSVGVAYLRHRRHDSLNDRRTVVLDSVIAVALGALVAGLLALATEGAIGPGRMVHVGATPHFVVLWFLAFVGVPFLVASFFIHPTTRARIGEHVADVRNKRAERQQARVAARRAEDARQAEDTRKAEDARQAEDARTPENADAALSAGSAGDTVSALGAPSDADSDPATTPDNR